MSVANAEHCLALITKWHEVRLDLEEKLFAVTQDNSIKSGMTGRHRVEIFHGHCAGEGGANYTRIQGKPTTFQYPVMQQLYQPS